jgi:hypothetical protein
VELIRSSKHDKKCRKCNSKFTYTSEDTWWDYSVFTNTKLVKCPDCGCVQAVKYEEGFGLDVNSDSRFYEYNKK